MALKKAADLGNTAGFKFEKKGDKLVGYYLKTTEETINGSNCKKHYFSTKTGIVTVLGQANMYKQLADNSCQGCMVEITFTGQALKLKGGKTMKVYEVYFDEIDRYSGSDVDTVGEVDQDEVDGYEEPTDDVAIDEDEPALDETPPARSTAPKRAATAPDPARRAAVQNLLNGRTTKRA